MFDMSWGEVMVIGAVALIVIGPKDLPKALRTVGQATAKLRRMAAEFQSQFQEAMREAELDEVRKQVEGVNSSVSSALSTGFNPIQTLRDELKGAVEKPVAPPIRTEAEAASGAAHPANPADPTAVPSVDLPIAPLPPIEPPLPEPSLPEPPVAVPPDITPAPEVAPVSPQAQPAIKSSPPA